MENTNEKLTIKEKAKEIYRKNKPIVNAVVIGVGAVGSWYIVRGLMKKDKADLGIAKAVDTNDDFNWEMESYLGDGGRWNLLIPETLKGLKTLDEVIEDIKDGNYEKEML